MNKKKFISLLLVLVLSFCAFLAAGCVNDKSNKYNVVDNTQTENKDNNDQNGNQNENNDNDDEQNTNINNSIDVLGFGDSISAGYAVSGSDMYDAYVSYNNGENEINTMCFTNIIVKQLKHDYTTVNAKSYAESGDKTADLVDKLQDKVTYPNLENDVKNADVITLCIGANNVLDVMLDNLENYFTGAITLNEIEIQLQQGLSDFKNDYTNTIIPFLTQGSAKVYVMTIYDPYKYFDTTEIKIKTDNEMMEMLATSLIGKFDALESLAMSYLTQVNEYIKQQNYKNVVVVDVNEQFESLSKSEYRIYINADSSKVEIDVDEILIGGNFNNFDLLKNNPYFDPHPTSLGQEFIANLFLESINVGNN